ncbi:MAG: thermonuclease family protein [Armatimonadota bacterium]|nr:thermonuclease family protein [bacterium]
MRRGRRSRNSLIPLFIAIVVVVLARTQSGRLVSGSSNPPRTDAGSSYKGKCVGISDGDTIKVMHLGREEKIRLWGIDCPEKKQAYGSVAKKFTSDKTFGKIVKVEVRDYDRYGRTVGSVILPSGNSLNLALVKTGLAWWYKQYAPNDFTLSKAEDQARTAKLGLWKDKSPTPPWEFRRERRKQ